MSDLFQKVSTEDKTIMLMDNFNIDLLKYNANLFLPQITTPTRVTLIDTTFSNNIEDGLISRNITSNLSNHFAQFLLQKDIKIDKNKPNLLIILKT